MLIDMHTHLECLTKEGYPDADKKIRSGMMELEEREKLKLLSFFSLGTPEEWKFMTELENLRIDKRDHKKQIWKSFGIHPWYSDQYEPDQYMEYFQTSDAVGEIGMDSVWCGVSLERQKDCFVRQLQIAEDLKKPIVLHTKGQEQEIYELVKDYPGKVCVHWYSGDTATFEKYLELGCWFTLGPDLGLKYEAGQKDTAEMEEQNDKASMQLYQHMVQRIPAEKLFLETDGADAVAWAYDVTHVSMKDAERILRKNLRKLARSKECSEAEMEQILEQNMREFLKK